MEQLVYVSIASEGFAGDDLFRILEHSSRKNAIREITGFLIFREGRFLQFVEGESPSLDELLVDLESDPRHHSIEIVERGKIDARRFPRWRMKRVSANPTKAEMDQVLNELRSMPDGKPLIAAVEQFLDMKTVN